LVWSESCLFLCTVKDAIDPEKKTVSELLIVLIEYEARVTRLSR